MKWLFTLTFTLAFLSLAEVSLPLKNSGFFSIEDLPGEGKIEFKIGEQTEVVELGKDKTQYGMGIVFSQKNLPESFNRGLGKLQLIQIALGNRGKQPGDSVTQFGAFMLRTDRIPTNTMIKLPLLDSGKADREPVPGGFIIFNSSQFKMGIEDQEKLKTTFFSERGEITLVPSGTAESLMIRKEGYKKLPFKRQMMDLIVEAQLGTPFSSEKGTLKGTVKFPLYWPSGEDADSFVSKLAQESLERHPEIGPEGEATRGLASPSSPKKNRK